ncbi:MAG: CpaF family protein, partial [Beijerinckiaceae bacterium]|nr:CpaF family protein [Beijerinckiaceae bacterium]
MFGKRSTGGAAAPALAVRAPTPTAPVQRQPEPSAADPRRPAPVAAPEPQRSEEYYQMKSMIFGARIEAIDLSLLAKLDGVSARGEIRD